MTLHLDELEREAKAAAEWVNDPHAWNNGRLAPDVVIALIERVRELECRVDELEDVGFAVRELVEDIALHGRQADAPFTTQERAQKMLATIGPREDA